MTYLKAIQRYGTSVACLRVYWREGLKKCMKIQGTPLARAGFVGARIAAKAPAERTLKKQANAAHF